MQIDFIYSKMIYISYPQIYIYLIIFQCTIHLSGFNYFYNQFFYLKISHLISSRQLAKYTVSCDPRNYFLRLFKSSCNIINIIRLYKLYSCMKNGWGYAHVTAAFNEQEIFYTSDSLGRKILKMLRFNLFLVRAICNNDIWMY